MSKKKYQKSADDHQQDTGQEQGGQPMNIQTILLGVIAIALVVQTFLLLTDDGGSPAYVPSGTAAAPAAAPAPAMSAQPAQPANNTGNPNINVTMPNQQQAQPQAQPAQPAQAANTTAVTFSEKTKDFGTVSRTTAPMQHTFTVTNSGAQPLTYTQVRGDAGTTVTSFPTGPIPPGGSGEIKIQFDPSTANGNGIQSWNIHLDGNTNPSHQHLIVQANIQN